MKEMEFELDKSSKVKLYHQLYQIFVSMITKGELAQGSRLPSIRNLSEDYGISRNTVTKAYSELEKDGYIYSLSKSGFFVKNPDEIIPSEQSVPKTEQEDDDIPKVDSLLRNSTSDTDSIISKDTEGDLLHSNLDADSVIQKTDTIILKDSFSLDQIVPPDSSAIPLDNSGNKEHTILMNSGDIVESDSNNEVILSPNEAFIDSCITALAEHHNRITIRAGGVFFAPRATERKLSIPSASICGCSNISVENPHSAPSFAASSARLCGVWKLAGWLHSVRAITVPSAQSIAACIRSFSPVCSLTKQTSRKAFTFGLVLRPVFA